MELTRLLLIRPGDRISLSLRTRDRARSCELLDAFVLRERRQRTHGNNRRERACAVARLL